LQVASLAQSSRAPTAVELACASEDAPCSLPNAFLADPPLDEVVAHSVEAGLRGQAAAGLAWHAGAFRTTNRNDILFQSTGGSQANVGFFQNVSDTRRQGAELGVSGNRGRLAWTLEYSLIDATFRDEFIVNSPNHPPVNDELVAGDGKLRVLPGASIPGIPRHRVTSTSISMQRATQPGCNLAYRSGVYLRGDGSMRST
jgi:outer membrane receptor protein involved in Fe transport